MILHTWQPWRIRNIGPVHTPPPGWSELNWVQFYGVHSEVFRNLFPVNPCHWCHVLNQKPAARPVQELRVELMLRTGLAFHLLNEIKKYICTTCKMKLRTYHFGLNSLSTRSRSKKSLLRWPWRLNHYANWDSCREDHTTDWVHGVHNVLRE